MLCRKRKKKPTLDSVFASCPTFLTYIPYLHLACIFHLKNIRLTSSLFYFVFFSFASLSSIPSSSVFYPFTLIFALALYLRFVRGVRCEVSFFIFIFHFFFACSRPKRNSYNNKTPTLSLNARIKVALLRHRPPTPFEVLHRANFLSGFGSFFEYYSKHL